MQKNGKAEDKRVRKTRGAFRAALATLLQEKRIHTITVQELCRKAGVNRSTFYTHYKDIYHLRECVENELYEGFCSCLYPIQDVQRDLYRQLVAIYRFFGRNADISVALLGVNGDLAFSIRLRDALRQVWWSWLEQNYPDVSPNDWQYSYQYTVYGLNGILKEWLMHGRQESAEYMGGLTVRLMTKGIHAVNDELAQWMEGQRGA